MGDRALLTNHAHVLLCVAGRPELRLREIADCVGLTERAVHRLISELEEDGYIERKRVGRCNSYRLRSEPRLRHGLESRATVGELVDLFADGRKQASGRKAA